jgi:hypothetical protein
MCTIISFKKRQQKRLITFKTIFFWPGAVAQASIEQFGRQRLGGSWFESSPGQKVHETYLNQWLAAVAHVH